MLQRLALVFGCLVLGACSSDPTTDSNGDAAASSEAAADDGSSSADGSADDANMPADASPETLPKNDAGCTTLASGGANIVADDVASAPPPGTGGTVADGTYFLTNMKIYTGAGGATGPDAFAESETITIAGDAVERAAARVGFAIARLGGTYLVFGTTINFTYDCPTSGYDNGDFTATPTTLVLYSGTLTGTLVATYTKQ